MIKSCLTDVMNTPTNIEMMTIKKTEDNKTSRQIKSQTHLDKKHTVTSHTVLPVFGAEHCDLFQKLDICDASKRLCSS